MSDVVDMPRKEVPPPLELVKERIDEVLPPDVQGEVEAGEVAIVDTREPEKFEQGHIPGAVNVPAGENGVDSHSADFATKFAEATEGKPALLYCNTGNRSARAADALTNEHGVEGARSLVGGVKLWDDLGLPVEGTVEVEEETDEEEDED
ncbi:MAG: rhodanese-like domain-containing protein [Solirubrobacterales bacterium]